MILKYKWMQIMKELRRGHVTSTRNIHNNTEQKPNKQKAAIEDLTQCEGSNYSKDEIQTIQSFYS